MFSLASGIYQNYFGTPQLNVLLIGMEDVGKTTLLERLKVTQFSKKGTQQTTVSTKMKRSLSCPAPPKYANAKVLQDDDDDEIEGEDSFGSQSERPSSSSRRWLNDKQQSSLEDVEWSSARGEAQVSERAATTAEIPEQRPEPTHEGGGEEVPDYNLKAGLKMLPLTKIRPTSGQNLAKIDICGAKCHIFDLCGKFRDLWERYYNDAEAVIFCWKLDDNNRDQASILEKVRKEIPDDVPILIFGHVVHPDTNDQVFELGALPTEAFLPNYHSNVMQVYCGSAKTGKGVREAMEWLIPLAKRQAALRNAAAAARVALEQKPL